MIIINLKLMMMVMIFLKNLESLLKYLVKFVDEFET